MKKHFLLLSLIILFSVFNSAYAQLLATEEGFDDVSALDGWIFSNQSSPIGETSWFQGSGVTAIMTAESGDLPNSFIAANYRSVEVADDGVSKTICNYLILPELGALESFSFYTLTRRASNNFSIYPDRLYLVRSPSGEINTGNCTEGFGDFTETLLVVNPDLTIASTAPEGYPRLAWQNFTTEVNGAGRLAFVYYVTDAGYYGVNSNYIGIDTVQWTLAPLVPLPPTNTLPFLTGLNYDPAHSGHGFSIADVGNNQFFTVFYSYDNEGNPEWFSDLGLFEQAEDGNWKIDNEQDKPIKFSYDFENGSVVIGDNPEQIGSITHQNCSNNPNELSIKFNVNGEQGSSQSDSLEWCSQAIVGDAQRPQNDFSGLWWAGEEDSGWGWSMEFIQREESIDLIVILYYYDAQGNPRWLIGTQSGFVVGEEITVAMDMVKGYSRQAEAQDLQLFPAGTMSFTLNQASNNLLSAGTMSVDVDYPGAEGGQWQRTDIPAAMFSTPRN